MVNLFQICHFVGVSVGFEKLLKIMQSLVDAAIRDGVEAEKCVVGQHRTTSDQKNTFMEHIRHYTRTRIPIEWVIDIADETSGWFYGTAYYYNDVDRTIHVMVPDKLNPTYSGDVPLDHRTVHFIECVDGKTDALFNKIVRDNVVKVRWEVEWLEDDISEDGADSEPIPSHWTRSFARYYIQMTNQILVEDSESAEDGARSYVMLGADGNIRLLECVKGKGQEDFDRLVLEGIVQAPVEAVEGARSRLENKRQTPPSSPKHERQSNDTNVPVAAASNSAFSPTINPELYPEEPLMMRSDPIPDSPSHSHGVTVRKLSELSSSLRSSVFDLITEREADKKRALDYAQAFQAFVMDGDLQTGYVLWDKMTNLREQAVKQKNGLLEDTNADLSEEAKIKAQKMEKGLMLLVKTGGTPLQVAEDRIEELKKINTKLKKALDIREKENNTMRSMMSK